MGKTATAPSVVGLEMGRLAYVWAAGKPGKRLRWVIVGPRVGIPLPVLIGDVRVQAEVKMAKILQGKMSLRLGVFLLNLWVSLVIRRVQIAGVAAV